jgi:hypothetical protein
MSVTEHLMRPGTWSLKFRPDVPVGTTKTIADLIDESSATGYGGHIVITPTRVDPDAIGDAATLAAASYTGRIMKRPSRLSLDCRSRASGSGRGSTPTSTLRSPARRARSPTG